MANRFPLIFNSTANQIQELAASDNLDLTSCGISSVNNVNSAGIVTATAFAGYDYLQAPFGSTIDFAVTVASKTSAHRYQGTGSSNGYVINGVESPFLTLTPGRTYRFTLSSGDMTSHPFRFYEEADKTTPYTTNVTSTSTYTEITVTDSTPQVLHYQCSAHGYMGNSVNTNSNVAAGGGGGGGGSGQFNTGISSAIGYPITTSMATAYTATDAVVVHSVHITNIDGSSSADISGQMYAGAYSIAHTVPVPAGSSVEMLKQPKVLNTGETLQLQASATGDLHATISLEPQTGSSAFIGVGTDITAATTYTDLYTAAADTVLQGILLANDEGSNDVKATVVWTDSGNTIVGYFAYEMVIPADATVEILEQPKFLPSGYKVRVQANEADRLEAILSAKTA